MYKQTKYTYRSVFHWNRARSVMTTSYAYSCVIADSTYRFHVPAGTPETVEIMARLHAMLGADSKPSTLTPGTKRLLQSLSSIKRPWTHDKEAAAELLRMVTRAAAGSGRSKCMSKS
jgi:hypothetical protein